MDIEDLVAVHLTKYFPKNKTISTLNSNLPEYTLRNTIHFAINHPVENIGFYGSWDTTAYAILTPLNKLCTEPENHVWNFNVVDTYFVGDVKLPAGSTIIVSSQTYEEVIKQGIVDRETIMSKFGDDRCKPNPEDQLVIEKEGIKYIVLSWNSEDLRTETYQEIAKQGYNCMPGGQYNWGTEGAQQADQQRIADKIHAKKGNHCDDELKGIEELSHQLVNFISGIYIRPFIDAYLKARQRGFPNIVSEHEEDDFDAELGMQRLSAGSDYNFHLPNLIKIIEKEKEHLPTNYHRRIDRFLEGNKRKLRAFLPQEVIEEFALPLY